MRDPHTTLFAIVTVAFIALAAFLVYMATTAHNDQLLSLATGIIGALVGMWLPSPIQAKGGRN